ncbi:hypothetical protein TSUD_271450, partial [Trifolium subterraneum]
MPLVHNRSACIEQLMSLGYKPSLFARVKLPSFLGRMPVSNPILKEILLNSDISRVSCVAAYCIVTPLLEEVVYRGFLLTSLSSTLKWQNAV